MPMIAGLKTRAMGSFRVSCSTTLRPILPCLRRATPRRSTLLLGVRRMHRPSLPNQRLLSSHRRLREVVLPCAPCIWSARSGGKHGRVLARQVGEAQAAVPAAARPKAVVEASMDAPVGSVSAHYSMVPLLLQRSPAPHPPLRLADGARIPCISFARASVHSSAHRRVASPTSSTCMRGCSMRRQRGERRAQMAGT